MDSLLKYLPLNISRLLAHQNDEILNSITEIRLRERLPFSVSIGPKSYFFNENGEISKLSDGMICSSEDVSFCLERLCAFSLYSFEDTIKKGYIPLGNGYRAGVCGEFVTEGKSIISTRRIRSINIRIPRQKKLFASRLFDHFAKNGITDTLVISPPSFGKTTFLKSIAALLSESGYKVGLADERFELYVDGMAKGLIDVISGCPKPYAIEIFARTMSPDVIICDEISPNECEEIKAFRSTGVTFIASLHARSIPEALSRPYVKEIVESGDGYTFVVLKNGYSFDIISKDEILAQQKGH